MRYPAPALLSERATHYRLVEAERLEGCRDIGLGVAMQAGDSVGGEATGLRGAGDSQYGMDVSSDRAGHALELDADRERAGGLGGQGTRPDRDQHHCGEQANHV